MKRSPSFARAVASKTLGMAVVLFLVLGFSSPSGGSWFGLHVPTPFQGSATLNGGGASLREEFPAFPISPRSNNAGSNPRFTTSFQPQGFAAAASVDQFIAPLASASPPTRVIIPSISVDAKIIPVGIDPTTKSLVVPVQGSVVGWFSKGLKQRPTVLVGHVDTAKKAAVFYRLPRLRTGDPIQVTNSDDSVRRYRVERITRVGKNSFPTKSVYLGSGLRLITCGGKFDRKTGHYEDNIIVFAKAA